MSMIRAAGGRAADGPTEVGTYDAIIVGAGISGLVAGWLLRDRRVLVLESGDRTGGRVLSESRGPYWANLGAHLILENEGLLARYAHTINVPLIVPAGSLAAVCVNGQIVRAGRPEGLPFRLPLRPTARISLMRTGVRLLLANRHVTRAHRNAEASPRIGVMPADSRLDAMTFADVLGPMHPDVAELMRVTANRMGAEPDRLSADKAVHHTMATWASRRANIVGGTSELTDALTAGLGSRILKNAVARRIVQSPNEVTVEALVQGRPRRFAAVACIVTVPAPIVRQIVDGLSPEKDAALGHIDYGPYVVAGMFTSESRPMLWDDVYAMAVPRRSFSMAFNPANPLRTGQRRPGGSLVVYAAGGPADRLLPLSDTAITECFLQDLHEVLPGVHGTIREVIIKRWPHGIPVARPGRARLQPQIAAPHGRVFFAGDYMMDPGVDSAAWTAEVAVNDVRALLALTLKGRGSSG